jgi:hypothetical protein
LAAVAVVPDLNAMYSLLVGGGVLTRVMTTGCGCTRRGTIVGVPWIPSTPVIGS